MEPHNLARKKNKNIGGKVLPITHKPGGILTLTLMPDTICIPESQGTPRVLQIGLKT